MFNSGEMSDIEILMRYLQDVYPQDVANTEDLLKKAPPIVNRDKVIKFLEYCREKGLITATPIRTDQEGIVDFSFIKITARGIDGHR